MNKSCDGIVPDRDPVYWRTIQTSHPLSSLIDSKMESGDVEEALALIRYYARKQYYQHMIQACLDWENDSRNYSRSAQNTVLFLKSVALLQQGRNIRFI